MKILLTGITGQVGQDLYALLPALGDVIALSRQQLDLTDPAQIRRVIRESRPQLIVNAAAYTAVDRAESDEATAFAVNAHAPGVIAEAAKEIGAAVVHYSTDYVFDGTSKRPYDEDDIPNPINVYGKTKRAGEIAIQQSGVPYLIFRCAWVYATRGRNFLLAILRLATQREELRIVNDQFGAPTWSTEIAVATNRVLANVLTPSRGKSSIEDFAGIYHLAAAGQASWFEFAQAILKESGAETKAPWFAAATEGRPILAKRIVPITADQYPTAALRPAYSVLSSARLKQRLGVQLPDWRVQLHAAFHEPLPS
jgi:dTDP-4-dehydrorhamnose reductase